MIGLSSSLGGQTIKGHETDSNYFMWWRGIEALARFTRNAPKPFIRLEDGQSLLQKTWRRGAMLPDVAEMMTVTNNELYFKTRDEYAEIAARSKIDLPNGFVLEPFGRNTAAAIAAAALAIGGESAETLMLVLPADHLIADQDAFARAVAQL